MGFSLENENVTGEGGAFPVTLLVLEPRRHSTFRLFPKHLPQSPAFWSLFTLVPSGFDSHSIYNGF